MSDDITNAINESLAFLGQPSEVKKQASQVERLKDRAREVGIDEALLEPRDSLFGTILNTLDKPKQVVQGVLDSAFIRQDIGEIGLLGAAERGLDERINAFDILRRETDLNPIARGVLGFGAELLTDPLNFLSFGAVGAAKAGGRTLSKAGVAKSAEIVKQAVAEGDDLFKAHTTMDEVFRGLGDIYDARKTLASSSSDLLKTQARYAEKRNMHLLEAFNIAEDEFSTLFKKPGIKISTSLPFLGHVKDDFDAGAKAVATAKVADDSNSFKSLIRGAYGLAGDIVKPGRIDIADIEFSDGLINSYNKAKEIASTTAKNVEDFFDSALKVGSQTPGLRLASKGVSKAKEGAKEFTALLGKTFSRSAVFGKRGADATNDFVNDKAIASYKALNDTREIFDGIGGKTFDEVLGPAFQEKRRLAGQLVDKAMEDSIAERIMGSKFRPEHREAFLAYLNESRINPDITFKHIGAFEGVEHTVMGRLKDTLADESIDPDVREFVKRGMLAFDDLRKKEAELGLPSGLVEAYIPHRYTNLEKSQGVEAAQGAFGYGPGKASFQQGRKYDSLKEAFENKGYLANTDIGDLFLERSRQSYIAQAKKRYANRMLMVHGLPADVVRKLYEEVKVDPSGDAAKALARHKLQLPKIFSDEETLQALKNMGRVGDKEGIMKNPKLAQLVNESGVGIDNLIQNYSEGVSQIEDYILSTTGLLKDGDIPRLTFGEIARPIKAENGEVFYMPSDIAKGVDEVLASKDVVREFFKGSKAGEGLLNLMDTTTNAFKRLVTLPWPAYWSQNLFGDAFMRAADGGLHAIEPGGMARTMGLLRGTHSVTLRNGQVIDPKTFQRILAEAGINHSYDEAIDVLRSASEMDITKATQRTKGVLKNLKVGKDSGFNPLIAMEAASQNMKNTFENFFRANHVLHHIERGDSFLDAGKAANEAMINYRNLTEIEKSVFRRFYMFYGWIGGSTKKTITNLFTNPGALQQQLKGAQATAEFFSSPDAAPTPEEFDMKTLRSLVSEEQVAFALGKDKDGKPIIGRGFGLPLNTPLQQFSVQLPRNMQVGELIDTFGDSLSRTAQKQFASANPIISAVAERVTNRNLYFDKPLDTRFLRKLPQLEAAATKLGAYDWMKVPLSAVDDVTKEFLDGVPDGNGNLVVDPGKMWALTHIIPGLGRAISTTKTFSDSSLPLSAGLLKTFTGVRIEESDPTRSRLYDEKRELQETLRAKDIDLREEEKRKQTFRF